MTGRSHLAFWLLAALLLGVLPPLASGPQAVRVRLAAEEAAVGAAFGPALGGRLLELAWTWQPGESAPSAHAARGAARTGWQVLEEATRLLDSARAALHAQGRLVALRAVVALGWLVLLLPFAAAVAVDGFAVRRRKFETLGAQSPAAFTLALHAFIALAALPLLYLVAPFVVTPFFVPWWSVAAALPARHALTHAQPVFTR